MSEALTTREVADRLGVTPARVRQLILSGQLPADKFGRDLVIKASDLALVKDRPIGRPPKSIDAGNGRATKKKGSKR